MAQLPPEFHRFIKNIETGHIMKVYLSFKDVEELEACAAFFFKRAVMHPDQAASFAETGNKFYFVAPENDDTNFRKAISQECRKQVDLVCESLIEPSNITMEKAFGTFKFFGELFNIGYILKAILKKKLDFLAMHKSECPIAYRCYYTLLATVKTKISNDTEDYSIIQKKMIEMIEDAENPTEEPKQKKVKATSESFVGFPPLKQSPKNETLTLSLEDELKLFRASVDQLTTGNTAAILKEITENYKMMDGEKWKKFYEILIQRAFRSPEVTDAVLIISIKAARIQTDAWLGVKGADFKKFIQEIVLKKLEELLSQSEPDEAEVSSILNFIRKLLDHSLCSIGCLASFIDFLIENAEKNNFKASRILMQLILAIKPARTAEQIKKISEEKRAKILQILVKNRNGKISEKDKSDINMISLYFGLNVKDVMQNGGKNSVNKSQSPVSSEPEHSPSPLSFKSDDYYRIPPMVPPMVPPNQVNGVNSLNHNNGFSRQFVSPYENYPKDTWNGPIARPNFPPQQLQPPSSYSMKIHYIEMAFRNINFNFMDDCVIKIRSLELRFLEEFEFLANYLLRLVSLESDEMHVACFANLSQKLGTMMITTDNGVVVFRQLLTNKFEHAFLDFFKPKINQHKSNEAYNLTRFIAELYILDFVSFDVVNLCMDVLLRHELSCNFSVFCINIMIRTIGPKLKDHNAKVVFDRYFQFFAENCAKKEHSYRLNTYRELIELRKNNWGLKVVEQKIPEALSQEVLKNSFQEFENFNYDKREIKQKLLENGMNLQEPPKQEVKNLKKNFVLSSEIFEKQEMLENFFSQLQLQLKSPSRIDNFIAIMVDRSMADREFIPTCVRTIKELMNRKYAEEFIKEILSEKLMIFYAKSSCKENLKDTEKDLLSNSFIIFGELYREDIFADDNLSIWSFHKHLNQIPIQHISYVSSIITPKIHKTGNAHVKALLANLDGLVHSLTMSMLSSIVTDIDDYLSKK